MFMQMTQVLASSVEKLAAQTHTTEKVTYAVVTDWVMNQILGSENFTRWLVWCASTSTRDREKFLHAHHLRVHKVKKTFYQLVGFECSHHL